MVVGRSPQGVPWGLWVLCILCVLAAPLGVSAPAFAAPAVAAPSVAAPSVVGTGTRELSGQGPIRVLVVLDVSGSMKRPGGNGLTLLDGARNALGELLYSLPRRSEVGLRVYGSDYAGADRRRSCADTRLVEPVSPLAPARILRAANRLRPTGDTPIGLSLKYAAGDLRSAAPGEQSVIVLISDGEDNCSPPASPPCQVVAGLKRTGFKVRIETVGVALESNRAAKRALQCISGSTGGSYYDAADAPALSAALERISSEALGRLGRGQQVRQADRLSSAPLITPGTYRTTLRPGERAWYRFKATQGERPRVLATVEGLASLSVPGSDRNCPAWRAELYNPYGEGGTYPPYGNSGIFDGVGIGSTGASTTGRLQPYSKGIDYTGTWAIQLSLARDTGQTCSKLLPPRRAFPTRFALQVDRPGASPARSGGASASPSPRSSASPTAAPTDEGGPSAAAKYNTPARPRDTPAWVLPVTAVSVALLVGAAVAGVLLVRRRRQRGW